MNFDMFGFDFDNDDDIDALELALSVELLDSLSSVDEFDNDNDFLKDEDEL